MSKSDGLDKNPKPRKDLHLPADLENKASQIFDKLFQSQQITWEPLVAENAEDKGFPVQFQTAPHLLHKPINPISADNKPKPNAPNPFENPDPDWIVARLGSTHTLILNKFPVYRDSLIIHTNEFQLQSDDLDEDDLNACWSTLKVLARGDSALNHDRQWIVIYNCGLQAGSSQGHKHMQLWPVPSTAELGFELFPSRVASTDGVVSVLGIPFQHYIVRLRPDTITSELSAAYLRLLQEVRRCHEQFGSTAYNVAISPAWIMLVPRRTSGSGWGAGGNTAVVLGLLWINGPQERQIWGELGICEHLATLGVPANAK